MTDITPPPELRSQWFNETPRADIYDYIIEKAAQWGADQELEACCEWLAEGRSQVLATHLRAARRPKPPSLKQRALESLAKIQNNVALSEDHETIRRALEELPDD